ncbi:preprotein translocase subunit SecE [Pseudodesulfovibrio senegalensis]|jgi:preprotein translocase subunit SecE|uniref:Protein translocase subunit SecE n=1 Tax=Pseudodesulfovibrio senegalensis TaxID=1721087 RepID=A0A6N6N504_9BACT|nr:preprotein translocase subunit SecE [Pseudodesulfovibrio senegalensis]KAB1442314.1 preprotein translocase subunit SecE [Pseudodesulfovibrio senegalensis]
MARKKAKKVAPQQPVAQGGVMGKIHELKTFFEESKVEIKKVVWPSRKETVTTCVAVVVVTLVIALYLGVVDLGLSKLVAFILS